jgi:hypothetical protein
MGLLNHLNVIATITNGKGSIITTFDQLNKLHPCWFCVRQVLSPDRQTCQPLSLAPIKKNPYLQVAEHLHNNAFEAQHKNECSDKLITVSDQHLHHKQWRIAKFNKTHTDSLNIYSCNLLNKSS